MSPARTTALAAVAVVATALPAVFSGVEAEPREPIDCTAETYVARSLTTADDPSQGLPEGSELMLRFVNLSDTHIIDDEAPPVMNGNFLESALEPTIGNNSAQRLNEEFTDEVVNAMVSTINECHEREPLELMVTTGDLTDNATLNELRRYIDNLDGVSGADTAFEEHCGYTTHDSNGDPKLGAGPCTEEMREAVVVPTGKLVADTQQPTPDGDDPTYQLVPTRSARQIAGTQVAAARGGSTLVAPGLPEDLRCDAAEPSRGRANEAAEEHADERGRDNGRGFGSGGAGEGPGDGCANERLAVPHYAAFGNHDGYPRGTVTFQQPFQAGSLALGRYFFESQREWINEYFETRPEPGPVGHGFNHVPPERLHDGNDRNDGYYAFDAGGVRMVVLNTIADGVRDEAHRGGETNEQTGGVVTGNEVTDPRGLEMGVMDPAQFAWLDGQLDDAAAADRPVLVFSHHPDGSFTEYRVGEPLGGVSAEELDALLGSHENVVAWIAGHTHRNRIRPCTPQGCTISGDSAASWDPADGDGFWRVETASIVDFPQEGRIVEVWRLPEGGHALRLTMIRPDPNDPVARTSRELAVHEDQCTTSALLANLESAVRSGDWCHGELSADGGPGDRDTILLP